MNLTVAFFGSTDFFALLGKQGTSNDIAMRNNIDNENTITFVSPASEKLQPLLQCAAMADYPVVLVDEISKEVGEVIVLLHECGFSRGLIVTDFYEDKIREIIKDTCIRNFDFVKKDKNVVLEKIISFMPKRDEEPILVTIDNYFSVKGVGTVVLGLVKSGSVKQYDALTVFPISKPVTVKSMQSQDREVKETSEGQRIGLCLKGIESEEFKRGYVLSSIDIPCKKTICFEFSKNRYSKFELGLKKRVVVNIGLQVISGEITKLDKNIEVTLDNPIACYQKKCIIAVVEATPRIIGSGNIVF